MIRFTKDNTASPAVYSSGSGADPIAVALTLNGSGSPASVVGGIATALWVWANDDTGNIASYTGISVDIAGSDVGVTWELSLDGSTNWGASIALSNMDVTVSHQATRIYARASALNDGSVLTNNYVTPDLTVHATENPA